MTSSEWNRSAWTESGAHAVAPAVWRVPLPLPSNNGLVAVNVYVIEDGDGLVLIDAGWSLLESRRVLEASLAGIGHDLGEVERILVTHMHRDHYTQALAVRRLFGSRVHLGVGERSGLEQLHRQQTNLPLMLVARLRRHGATALANEVQAVDWGEFDPSNWEYPDEWLTATDLHLDSRALTVIPTPGHTHGHVVFLDADNSLLFSGDHVLPHITPSIGFEPFDADGPLADYLDSLHLVAGYPDASLLPAHGPPGPSVHVRVEELLAHHEARLADCLAAFNGTTLCALDVAEHLTWTSRHHRFSDLSTFNRMLAVNETIAHLDLLVTRGSLTADTDDGLVVYTAV